MTTATPKPKPITAYCRVCGKPLTEDEARPAQGTIFCAEHVPGAGQATTARPTGAVPRGSASPGLAFLLGLIPGVGAIYNGQYAKGIVHVLIFALLLRVASTGAAARGVEPLLGLLIFLMFPYMAFEAYHTAQKRLRGEPLDEFSSLMPSRATSSGFPVGPILLILLGVLFLLNTLDIIRFYQILRWWPV